MLEEEYLKQAAPKSFIHVDDFNSPKEMAIYLKKIANNERLLRGYHEWRKTYRVEYDYRFLGRTVFEKVCAHLNKRYDEAPKWHKKLTDFERTDKDCSNRNNECVRKIKKCSLECRT